MLIRPTLYSFVDTMAANYPRVTMWIDAICINQGNVEERSRQISIMGEIYKTAQEVYVWLRPGDDHTNYALEHIENSNPRTQFDKAIFSTCVERLFGVSYWTRLWVIQEFALAQEVIVVCGRRLTNWRNLTREVHAGVLGDGASALVTLENFTELIHPWSDTEPQESHEQYQIEECPWQNPTPLDFRSHGRTELSYAAGDGHIDYTKRFLSEIAIEVNSRHHSGRTPLSWACRNGHDAVVNLLVIRDDVEVDFKDTNIWTTLSCAMYEGHEKVVEVLLGTRKVNLDCTDENGWTPLSWAACGRREKVVQALLRTPLSLAASGGHENIVQVPLDMREGGQPAHKGQRDRWRNFLT